MKIGGRFEFDPATGVVDIWFSTGGHRSYDSGTEPTAILKAFRGEIPIRLTGGAAVKNDQRLWREQLSSSAADDFLREKKAAAKASDPDTVLTDEDFQNLLGEILK